MRLDKYISTLTDLSRKDVKAALKYGRISVGGVPARDPAMQVDERTATVTLDGAALMFKRHTHIMMNKPAGVLDGHRGPRAKDRAGHTARQPAAARSGTHRAIGQGHYRAVALVHGRPACAQANIAAPSC